MEVNKYIRLFERFLQNETSEQEQQQLEELLRNDSHIGALLEKELEKADTGMDKKTSERLYGNIRTAISPGKKPLLAHPAWKRTLRWAAIIMLPLISALTACFLTIGYMESDTAFVTVSANNGEKAEITLADGSRVWLNSGSSLSYHTMFSRKERNVYLTGEAYFEVAKDGKRPFTVKTKEMDVRALGTAFNVSAYDDEPFTSSVLVKGKVRVTAYGQTCILEENERVIYNKTDHTLSTDMVYASDFVEWKNGNLYFQNRSFEEIANTLSRVFNVDISFVSEKLRPIRFSGTLSSSSIRNTLDILTLTSPMRYQMNGTTIELYHRN